MNYAELNLSQAQVFGNVELKTAMGTLPDRLTIEKVMLTHVKVNGWNSATYHDIKIQQGAGKIALHGNESPWQGYHFIDLTTLVDDDAYTSAEAMYLINGGVIADYVYHLSNPGGASLHRFKKSDHTEISSPDFTAEMQFGSRPSLCMDGYIYVLMRSGKIHYYDLNLNKIGELSPTGMADNFTRIVSHDGETFICYDYVNPYIKKWIKSTDTMSTILDVSNDIANGGIIIMQMDIGPCMMTYVNNGNRRYAIWNRNGMLEFDVNGGNRRWYPFPTKLGDYITTPIYGGYNMRDVDFDGEYLVGITGGRPANRTVLWRYRFKENTFTESYAQWATPGVAGLLKKIFIEGGFHRGYGYGYATAQQIKVEYYTDHWIEYDVDMLQDINVDLSAISQIRIGLQERAFFSDRFPYVSKVGLLYEPAGDTTPPAKPTGLFVDEPPARPSGLSITASGGGGGGQTK